MALPQEQPVALLLREVRLVEPVQRQHEVAHEARGPGSTLLQKIFELDFVMRNKGEEIGAGGVLEEEPPLDRAETTFAPSWERQDGRRRTEEPVGGFGFAAPQTLIPGRMR